MHFSSSMVCSVAHYASDVSEMDSSLRQISRYPGCTRFNVDYVPPVTDAGSHTTLESMVHYMTKALKNNVEYSTNSCSI